MTITTDQFNNLIDAINDKFLELIDKLKDFEHRLQQIETDLLLLKNMKLK